MTYPILKLPQLPVQPNVYHIQGQKKAAVAVTTLLALLNKPKEKNERTS